jgi:hypothetical protein
MVLVGTADWFLYARSRYHGPTQDELLDKLATERIDLY